MFDAISYSVVKALGIVLVTALTAHIWDKVRKYGLLNAWTKSVSRKGSWTATIEHFRAMWSLRLLEYDTKLPMKARHLAERNINGRYVLRTGEKHNAEGKKKIKEKWENKSHEDQ